MKHLVAKLILTTALAHGIPAKQKIPMYIAGEFDAATTYSILNSCSTCYYELNPLYKPFASNPSAFPAMFIGDNIYLATFQKLHRNHKKLAWTLYGVAIALHVYCGVHNIRLENSR